MSNDKEDTVGQRKGRSRRRRRKPKMDVKRKTKWKSYFQNKRSD